MFNERQIEHWQQRRNEALSDAPWVEQMRELDVKRRIVSVQVLGLMKAFMDGEIDTNELRTTYDKKTRTEWDVFGLKGPSGAMFLNLLVKHIPDQHRLALELRSVFRLPADTESGKASMLQFVSFLDDVIRSGVVTKGQLQPARASFFLSSWWHLQNTEKWPVFYLSGRNALKSHGPYSPSRDTVADYFSYRDYFMALSSALGLSSWDLEHLFGVKYPSWNPPIYPAANTRIQIPLTTPKWLTNLAIPKFSCC